MTRPVVLMCKSYRADVLRARKLADSVARFNADGLAFYMAVPEADLLLFQEKMAGLPVELLTDEQVIAANPRIDRGAFAALRGQVAQQIVKSEFWRLELAENYVCLDSDCYFIKPFHAADFIAPDGTPYTVMHEDKDLLTFAAIEGVTKIARNRATNCAAVAGQFGRQGHFWDFGPVPVIWSAKVWRDLDERMFRPNHQTIIEAFSLHPAELNWYGEALLAFKSIPLLPIAPLFRCYHYEEQYYFCKDLGETEDIVAANYLGICMQSGWDKSLDAVKKFKFSSLRRRIKRALRL